jgi:hypothetical protein
MITFNIPSHISGDTWLGLSSLSAIDLDNNPIDLTDSLIEMKVKLFIDSPSVLYFTNNNYITIDDASTGVFSISSQIIDIPVGTYHYDIKVTESNGKITTCQGGTWHILSHITR